jgi:hypothetical protein
VRIRGIVIKFIQGWNHVSGEIQSEHGEKYKVITSKDIRPDCIGRRYLVESESVEFEGSYTIRRVAKNIIRPSAETKIIPSSHRELCVVIDENMLMRSAGGRLTTEFGALDAIAPDSIVECGVKKSAGHTMWMATDIRFIASSESEVDWALAEVANV